MKLQGKVLWTSQRDGNGIIIVGKTEYYFDRSVCLDFASINRVREVQVEFELNDKIKDCRCAHKVIVLN